MTDGPGKIRRPLEEDITFSDDDITKRLGVKSSYSYRLQIGKARSELVHKLGPKKVVLEFIRCLDQKHQTNNWLPIHILRESLKDLMPAKQKIPRELQDKILLELANSDHLIELGHLKKAQYSEYVVKQGIKAGQGKVLYFIRQKVITPEILEASVKLDPRILVSSSNLVQTPPTSKRASSELDPPDPVQILKKIVDSLDLSEPKKRASQVAFMLNKGLRAKFEAVCKQNGITIREGLHAALIVFNHNFGK
jgi:hypothetical protein